MSTDRITKLQQLMRSENIGALAVAPNANMHYLLGFHPHADERPCFLLISPDDAQMLMPQLNATDAQQFTDLPMHTYSDAEGPKQALTDLTQALKLPQQLRIALDNAMRTDFSLLLLEQLPNATPTLSGPLLGALRSCKDEAELRAIKHNALIADEVMQTVFEAAEPGMSEKELAAIAQEAFKARGANMVFGIIGASENGAFPHHHTSSRVLKEGDAVVIDIGATTDHYNSDITRMLHLGQPSAEYETVHRVVNDAVQAALAVIRPGIKAHEVDDAARQVITQAGYGEAFVHRTGHGLGLEVHEPPYITSASEVVLEPGMVFSVEPGIYLTGNFGVRLEEIVAVTDSGVAVMSELSRDAHVKS